MGLTVLAGAALFAAPLLIWWRYSAEIASDGGLYAFVERAAGRRVALVQGCIWTFSYFLYLPFTVTYLVYDQLPESFPGHRARTRGCSSWHCRSRSRARSSRPSGSCSSSWRWSPSCRWP